MSERERRLHNVRVEQCLRLIRRKLANYALAHVRTRWTRGGGRWPEHLRAQVKQAIGQFLESREAHSIALYHATMETDPARCNKHGLAYAYCRAMKGIGPLLGVLAMAKGLDYIAESFGEDDCRVMFMRADRLHPALEEDE